MLGISNGHGCSTGEGGRNKGKNDKGRKSNKDESCQRGNSTLRRKMIRGSKCEANLGNKRHRGK